MMVVADTTPLNYLILIHQVDLLPRLFGRVLIPPAVYEELQDPETPDSVRLWLAEAPPWLQVQPLRFQPDPKLDYLDAGEREAIALAEEWKADQILIDEIDARREAMRRQLPFIGTLGILRKGAQLDWLDLPSALARLQKTTFCRYEVNSIFVGRRRSTEKVIVAKVVNNTKRRVSTINTDAHGDAYSTASKLCCIL